MENEELTDLGNAKRLVTWHGNDLRYVPAWKTWLVWDGTRWDQDATGEVMRRAKMTAREMLRQAIEIEDRDTRERLIKHASRSESIRSLKAMIELAETESGMPAMPADLDTNPMLLNCQNGTLNLHTGELNGHCREDLITKICAVPYDAEASCPIFDAFVDRVLPEGDLQSFVRRAVGYSLTGDPNQEVFFFAYGPPASGKSTLLEGVKSALGSYATTADFESFLQKRDSGPRPDIARLAGARFVASVEVDDGKRLASGLVKTLVGGDTIVARFLYGKEFEFRPRFTLWLAANDEPRVRDDDEALWRRIRQVPFDQSIPAAERDPDVKAAICDPTRGGPAVLAWAVRGFHEYLEEGLQAPQIVKSATADYRQRMDPLADWIADCLVIAPGERATARQLYESYIKWCAQVGIRNPITRRALGRRLSIRGFEVEKDRDHTWTGIGVRNHAH